MNITPARCVAIGVYDNKGTLRRTIEIREDGTFDPFEVAANEMVYSVLDLGDGSKPSLAPWQTSHRPPLIVNRWAAFTDDELNRIGRGLLSLEFHALHTSQPARLEPQELRDEIAAEIERRRKP